MRVLIATKNQAKIEGAKKALSNYFKNIEIEGIAVDSEVNEQPVNNEIYLGANNRIKNLKCYAKQNGIEADLYLSIESGIYQLSNQWFIINMAIIEDNGHFKSHGTSPAFPVPDRFVEEIMNTNLSEVINKLFGEDKERHNQGGGIQLLTKNKITRVDLTEMAFLMALTKYINEEWR